MKIMKTFNSYFTYWIVQHTPITTYSCCIKFLITNKELFYTYTIKDELENTKYYQNILQLKQEALKEFQEIEKQRLENIKLKEKELKEKKQSSINLSQTTIQLLNQCIQDNQQLFNEYKNGNKKVINSLVGKFLGICKKQNLNVDPSYIVYYIENNYE